MNSIKFPNITPSRAAALVCRKRYYAEHVLKTVPREEFSPPMVFGIGIHTALQFLTKPKGLLPVAERNIEAEVRRAFQSQVYPEIALREADIRRALPMVTHYLAQDSEEVSLLDTEVFANFMLTASSLRKITFGAKFDALLVRHKEPTVLVVRDYKTSKSSWVDMANACIAIAVAKAKLNQFKQDYRRNFSDVVLELDFLDETGLRQRVVLGIGDVKSEWPELKSRARLVYNATEFPAEPGEYCPLCPLVKTCRPHQTVSMEEMDNLFV